MSEFKPYELKGNKVYPITINKHKELLISILAKVVETLTEGQVIKTSSYTDYFIIVEDSSWEYYVDMIFKEMKAPKVQHFLKIVGQGRDWFDMYPEIVEEFMMKLVLTPSEEQLDRVGKMLGDNLSRYGYLHDHIDELQYSTKPFK